MTAVTEEARPIWLKEHEECDKLFTPQYEFYMKNTLGTIRVLTCPTCGYEDVECLHVNNTVKTKEIKLICLLCGG